MFQEGKAENAAEAIKAMLSASANVVRGGERRQVEADLLVPGDVVVIKSGDKIPADMRVIQASNLQVGGGEWGGREWDGSGMIEMWSRAWRAF
jgi:P-type E1-E2 ATPase